jgi:hypothetical protein
MKQVARILRVRGSAAVQTRTREGSSPFRWRWPTTLRRTRRTRSQGAETAPHLSVKASSAKRAYSAIRSVIVSGHRSFLAVFLAFAASLWRGVPARTAPRSTVVQYVEASMQRTFQLMSLRCAGEWLAKDCDQAHRSFPLQRTETILFQ